MSLLTSSTTSQSPETQEKVCKECVQNFLQEAKLPFMFMRAPQNNDVAKLDLFANAKERNSSKPCEEIPAGLVGRLDINGKTTIEDVYNIESIRTLQPGGLFVPNCKEKQSVAIIIPYRDRVHHLNIVLPHLHSMLQRQQLKYTIFVIELAYPTQFNRGILANIGFLTASQVYDFSCYIIHDVDLLPADDRNMYKCSNNPVHLSVSNSKYGYKLPYDHYNGGIIAFTKEQYLRINGFSNAYFGWGKEDDDLHVRMMHARYKIERPDSDIGIYEELEMNDQGYKRDFTNPDNPMKDILHIRADKRFLKDGVNRVLYTRLAVEFRPLYTWVYVNTSELSVMQMVCAIDPKLKISLARVTLPS
ncbi:hypothetical protein ACF0H5_004856 [Mactra antiquata]